MYWIPKFKNLSPWPLPHRVPKDPQVLSKMAVERMCSTDLESEIEIFKVRLGTITKHIFPFFFVQFKNTHFLD